MYSFLVLGIIPGTNVAISFQAWLASVSSLALTIYCFRRGLRGLLSREFGLVRQPLVASQLHQRIHLSAR